MSEATVNNPSLIIKQTADRIEVQGDNLNKEKLEELGFKWDSEKKVWYKDEKKKIDVVDLWAKLSGRL